MQNRPCNALPFVSKTVILAPNGQVVAINYGVTQARRLSEQLARAGG
jgi:hypothetical protein